MIWAVFRCPASRGFIILLVRPASHPLGDRCAAYSLADKILVRNFSRLKAPSESDLSATPRACVTGTKRASPGKITCTYAHMYTHVLFPCLVCIALKVATCAWQHTTDWHVQSQLVLKQRMHVSTRGRKKKQESEKTHREAHAHSTLQDVHPRHLKFGRYRGYSPH